MADRSQPGGATRAQPGGATRVQPVSDRVQPGGATRVQPSPPAGGGPAPADTTWIYVPAPVGGNYTFVAAETEAVGGGAITLVDGSMDGHFVQRAWSLVSINDVPSRVQVQHSAGSGWAFTGAANGIQNTSDVLKFANGTMDPTAQFDLQCWVGGGVGGSWGSNLNRYSGGVMLWNQSAVVGESQGWLMGWGATGATTSSLNMDPYARSCIDAVGTAVYQRGSTSNEATTEFWSRIARGADDVVRAYYREDSADPWIEVVTAPVHDLFTVPKVKIGFFLTQYDATHGGMKVYDATFVYKAA